jgi:hypothetical protein
VAAPGPGHMVAASHRMGGRASIAWFTVAVGAHPAPLAAPAARSSRRSLRPLPALAGGHKSSSSSSLFVSSCVGIRVFNLGRKFQKFPKFWVSQ